ncbi:MAG: cyclodeaminase/cyclohydrolase family protein [Acidobacteriota bacterium]|nr:cyclodeaminase/cyclohydrolase family protein [Acidobacteriota bacterium]
MTLNALSIADFAGSLASDAPAPGGGSASAAAGAFGASLLEMVVGLTLGKEKYRAVWGDLEPLSDRLREARRKLLELVDEDTKAYDAVVAARRLPKETDTDKAERQRAIDAANVLATTVPMQTAFFAHESLKAAPLVFEKGNPNAASDAWVAALLLHGAALGALANVRINLPGVTDPELSRGFLEDAADLEKKAGAAFEKTRALARARGLAA